MWHGNNFCITDSVKGFIGHQLLNIKHGAIYTTPIAPITALLPESIMNSRGVELIFVTKSHK